MLTINDLRNNIIDLIKNNNVADLINYVEVNCVFLQALNNNEFDILIFSIESCDSLDIIQYILSQCQYEVLNYSFYCDSDYSQYYPEPVGQDICYRGYKVPLFSAIAKKKFRIADFLMEKGADINYRLNILNWEDINVVNYLYHIGSVYFDKTILRYIFSHGFNINCLTANLMSQFKNIYDNGLEIIFNHSIFDNAFILNMLDYHSRKKPLSNKQLLSLIYNEKRKIKIDRECYKEALSLKKYDIIMLFFNNDVNHHNLNSYECYDLLEKAVVFNNYNLVKSILNYKVVNNFERFLYSASKKSGEEINFENILIEAIEVENVRILQLLTELLISNYEVSDFKNAHFEDFLLVASHGNNPEVITFVLKLLLFVLSIEHNLNIQLNMDVSCFRARLNNSLSDGSRNEIMELGKIIISKNDIHYFNLILNSLIKTGNIDFLKLLMDDKELKPKIDINVKDRNDEYPLMAAFYSNNINIFKYLLDYGASINISGVDKDSYDEQIKPLISLAIKGCNYRILELLLKNPISIDKEEIGESDLSPFIEAIYNNKIDEIDFFVKTGCFDKTSRFITENYHFTPVSLAYLLNHQAIFKVLLDFYNLNDLDYYGYSILHYAILKKDVDTIHNLINRGVEVNYYSNANGHGHSALDIAINIKGERIILDLLKHKNISLNIPNEHGITPMITLLKLNNYENKEKEHIMEFFIQCGADVNFIDEDGNTPLVYAVNNNYLPIVKLLVKNGANVNFIIQNYMGDNDQSLLLYAMKLGSKVIIKFLIDYNACIDFTKKHEILYLIRTSKWRHTELFEYFAKYNTKNFNCESLQIIISRNRLDLLKILVENKLDVNIKDDKGWTPLAFALKIRRQQIIDFLISCGADT